MYSIQKSKTFIIASAILLAAFTNLNRVVQAADSANKPSGVDAAAAAAAAACSGPKRPGFLRANATGASTCSAEHEFDLLENKTSTFPAVINYAGAKTGAPFKVERTVRLNDLRSDTPHLELGPIAEFEARGFTFLRHANEDIFAPYGELGTVDKNKYVSSLMNVGTIEERTFTRLEGSGDVKSVSEMSGEARDKDCPVGVLQPHVREYMRNVAETILKKVKPDAKYVFFTHQNSRGEETEESDESKSSDTPPFYAFQAHSDLNSAFVNHVLVTGLMHLRGSNEDIKKFFETKRPVNLMNYWANIRPEPIKNTMLALNDNRTIFGAISDKTSKKADFLGAGNAAYSYHPNEAAGDLMADNWYFASGITNQEAYVFEQFKLQFGGADEKAAASVVPRNFGAGFAGMATEGPESEMNDKGLFGHNIFHSAVVLEDAPLEMTRVSVESRVMVF